MKQKDKREKANKKAKKKVTTTLLYPKGDTTAV
jgi:hypothetical protein